MDFFRIEASEFSILPKVLFEVLGFPISSTMMSYFFMTLIVFIFAFLVTGKIKTSGSPTKVQLVLEYLYSALFDLVEKIAGSQEVAKRIIPIILTIIIFVGFSNIFTLFPFIGALTYNEMPMFSTSTSDLNVTFGIAVTVILWTQFSSIRKNNIFKHIFKYIKIDSVVNGFKKGPAQGLLSFIDVFIGLLDIISEFARALSLSLRLFGNMFAGEVLMTLILAVFAIILPVPLMFYAVFSGVLQAIVFAALSASYFGSALSED